MLGISKVIFKNLHLKQIEDLIFVTYLFNIFCSGCKLIYLQQNYEVLYIF